MIPVQVMNDQAWDIRILTGEFNESVIRFGNIGIDGTTDMMTFNFKVISSPDTDLTEENEDLQQVAGDILLDVIEESIKNAAAVIKDRE